MREIADAVDIREVAQTLGVALGKNGKAAYCPSHSRGPGRGTPSMTFYRSGQGRQKFKCHSCGAQGDVIDLVSLVKDLPLKSAARWVEGKPEPLSKIEYPGLEEEPQVSKRTRVQACTAFMSALRGVDDFGVDWLGKQRGLLPETVQRFKLASIDERSAGIAMGAAIQATTVQSCVDLGLAARSGRTDTFYCPAGFGYHIAIPYLTDRGRVGHIQFRRISRTGEKVDRKYIHIKGGVPIPFNLPATRSAKRVFLVEGALDSMALSQIGVPALGLPGTNWLNEPRIERLLKRVGAETELVIGFDADEAGRKASTRILGKVQGLGGRPLQVRWPKDFSGDWCEWMMEKPDEAPDIEHVDPKLEPDEKWLGNLMGDGLDDLVAIASGEKESPQIMTGYARLDEVLKIHPGDMVVIAARPSVGKSHLVLSMMRRMSDRFGTRCLFVSLEMNEHSVMNRISKAELGGAVPEEAAVNNAKRKTKELPILVKFGSRDLDRIISYIRSTVKKHRIGLVAVDYLQIISCKGRAEHEEISHISKQLKALANELLVPIVAVAQMNRAVESRKGGSAMMSDLRGSGQIEQDADSIVFLSKGEGEINLNITKQRNAEPGQLRLSLPEPFGWFEDHVFDYQSSS